MKFEIRDISFLFYFIFCSTGNWTWGLALARQAMSPILLLLVFQSILSNFPWASLGQRSSYLYLLDSWDYRCAVPHLAAMAT
jgi:hypothetical protein